MLFKPGMKIRYFFLLDPESDPTCNNGFMKLFHLEQNINQNLLKMMVYKIEFLCIPTYNINIFFSLFLFKVGSAIFFLLSRIRGKNCRILIPDLNINQKLYTLNHHAHICHLPTCSWNCKYPVVTDYLHQKSEDHSF